MIGGVVCVSCWLVYLLVVTVMPCMDVMGLLFDCGRAWSGSLVCALSCYAGLHGFAS